MERCSEGTSERILARERRFVFGVYRRQMKAIGHFGPTSCEAVGPSGRVVAVDISPEMISLARQRVTRLGIANIAVREGPAEGIPAEDDAAAWEALAGVTTAHLSVKQQQEAKEAVLAACGCRYRGTA